MQQQIQPCCRYGKRAREIRDDAVKRDELLDTKTVSLAIDDIMNGKYVVDEPEELKSEK